VSFAADISGNTIAVTFTAQYDAVHTGLVSVVYGLDGQTYAWEQGTLTDANIYTPPSSFSYHGALYFGIGITLKQNTPCNVVLRFIGGDLLFSSIVPTQVLYVTILQDGNLTTVDTTSLVCSDASGTVTILGLAPASTTDLTIKVRLRGPDGALIDEMGQTVPANEIVPEWLPTATSGATTTSVPAPYKLVVGCEVGLVFAFTTTADFPTGSTASALFSLAINGTSSTLVAAWVDYTGRTITLPYQATRYVAHVFNFAACGQIFSFTIGLAEVYEFPSIAYTVRSVPFVTLGQSLTLTSSFTAFLPYEVTGSIVVTPQGHAAVTYTAEVGSTTAAITISSVAYDVSHTGEIMLQFGTTTKLYSWATTTLTSAEIYTFPSSFGYPKSSEFGTQIALKQNTPRNLVLSFIGGDILFSSVVSAQVEYVKYVQSGISTTVDGGSILCSDMSGTVTVLDFAPVETTNLTIKVQMRGPDGALSAEMSQTVLASEIAPEWLPTSESGMTANIDGASYMLIKDSAVQLAFTFIGAVDFPTTGLASDLFMFSVRSPVAVSASIATATVFARTITLSYTATAVTQHQFVFTSFYNTTYTFSVNSDAVYSLPSTTLTSYHLSTGTGDDLVLGVSQPGVVMVRVWREVF
jgi:hypothetical protein